MDDKYLISIKEASKRYGIGEHRLRKILSEDYECKYHLMIGRAIRIKTKQFEEYLDVVKEL